MKLSTYRTFFNKRAGHDAPHPRTHGAGLCQLYRNWQELEATPGKTSEAASARMKYEFAKRVIDDQVAGKEVPFEIFALSAELVREAGERFHKNEQAFEQLKGYQR